MSDLSCDVAVIGGGPAGLAAAYALARRGVDVVVFERGEYPGAKNVFGGTLYTALLRRYLPELAENMPFERKVTRHLFYLAGDNAYTALDYCENWDPLHFPKGVTILRSRFDRWMAEKAESAGAGIISSTVVRDIVWRDDRAVGVVLEPGGSVTAKVLILAEGVNGFLTRMADLAPKLRSDQVSLGIKQTLRLEESVIDERFQVRGGQGASCLFIGSPLERRPGGGFLYTNRDTVSLGLVVPLNQISSSSSTAPELLAGFKESFPVRDLILGATPLEYAAHLIPTAGLAMRPRLVGPSFLVAGDAAGLVINTGFRIRGLDLAVASGLAAAGATVAGLGNGGVDQSALAAYPHYLHALGVEQEMVRFRKVPEILKNKRLYGPYPDLAGYVFGRLTAIGDDTPSSPGHIVREAVRSRIGWRNLIMDLRHILKIG